MEENIKIAFLDVLVIRKNNTLKRTVYRKKTHNGVYLHWKSFVSPTRTRSTLRSIVTRACRICSIQDYLEAEHIKNKIKHEFTQASGYAKWLFKKVNQEKKLSGNHNITTNKKSNNQ